MEMIFIFLSFCIILVRLKVIASYVVPHGDAALDPDRYKDIQELYNETKQLHNAYVNVGKRVSDLHPDLVFITTPHGVALSYNFALYHNERGIGDANSNEGDFSMFKANISLDLTFSTEFFQKVHQEYENIDQIVAYSEGMDFPIGWGAVIPSYFLETYTTGSYDYSVLSFPRRRLDSEIEMIPELLSFGELSFSILDNMAENIVIIISGDLSHVHKNRFGPNPFPIRPEIAAKYDSLIVKWIETMDSEVLLKDIKEIADQALSCGYTEFVFLEGMFQKARKEKINIVSTLIQKPLAPTWYGMGMGEFLFE